MCGIWSFATIDEDFTSEQIKKITKELFRLSETRGKEASGIAGFGKSKVYAYKAAVPGSELVKTSEFEKYWEKVSSESQAGYALLGHSRLATNGSESAGDNNQPVCAQSIVTVHNGIIVNVEELWKKYQDLQREHEVDTEIFVKLFEKFLKESKKIDYALSKVYSEIRGMASTVTLLASQNILVAATNNGSLYYCKSKNGKSISIASESLILKKLIQNCRLEEKFNMSQIRQLKVGRAMYINLTNMKKISGDFTEEIGLSAKIQNSDMTIDCQFTKSAKMKTKFHAVNILDENKLIKYDIDIEPIKKLRRCTKCVLPETMPFIEFDDEGVCNYCRTYQKQQYKGREALEKNAMNLRNKRKGTDSLVSFSGGRDSSYGLHYFVKELGLKPVAFSYDWGMVTDLARRNQSRMCEQLGVELIVVSADIRKKRENIRKNVTAWLKKPDMGMVPLFMAGDKQYFFYANKVKRDFGLDMVLLASNPFERTYFKSGYCGIKPEILCKGEEKRQWEQLPLKSVIKMTGYYGTQYITNPAYVNKSIWDTAKAALSYYVIPHDYFLLYDYIPWDEKEVNEVLLKQYDWETASDTKSTWRIGDGTAPFYNYIYYLVTGFSENDTLRSNQIREGMIRREKALELVYEDNKPRFDSMKWYFDAINVNMKDALEIISKIPKLYERNKF